MKYAVRSLSGKLMMSSVLFFLISSGSIGYIIHYMMSSQFEAQLSEELEQRAEDLASQLEDKLLEKKRTLRFFTENSEFKAAVDRKRFSVAGLMFEDWVRDRSFRQFMLTDAGGTVLASQRGFETAPTVTDEPWFAEARTGKNSSIRCVSDPCDSAMLWMALPLNINEIRYYICAQVDWGTVIDFLNRLSTEGTSRYPDRYIDIYSHDGTQAYSDRRRGSSRDQGLYAPAQCEAFNSILKSGKSGTFADDDCPGNTVMAGYCAAAQFPLSVIVSTAGKDGLSIARAAGNRTIGIALTISAISLMGLLIMIRRITRPIQELAGISSGISGGRLPEEPLQLKADRDSFEIVRAFNVMNDGIKNRDREIQTLHDNEEKNSLELTSAISLQEKHAAELHQKDEELKQTKARLEQIREEFLKMERLAAVGEIYGQGANEIINSITGILSVIENDLTQWEDYQEITGSIRQLIKDWETEFEKDTLSEYLNQVDSAGRTYGEEDFTFLSNFVDDSTVFMQKRRESLDDVARHIQRVKAVMNSIPG